jgi:hypothetical protein
MSKNIILEDNLLLGATTKQALRSTQIPIQWVSGIFPWG